MIWLVWLILFVVFLALSWFNWRESKRKVEPFSVALEGKVKSINGIDTGLGDLRNFIDHFNKYIDNYNNSSKRQNIIASAGYLLAALTAMVSMILSILEV
jgi:hypothetical protein